MFIGQTTKAQLQDRLPPWRWVAVEMTPQDLTSAILRAGAIDPRAGMRRLHSELANIAKERIGYRPDVPRACAVAAGRPRGAVETPGTTVYLDRRPKSLILKRF
jgi:hypothetical protein